MTEIELLRADEALQARRMAELDLLARNLAHKPFTIMVTVQMGDNAWAIVERIADNEMGFVSGPFRGSPPDDFRPEPGHVLIVSKDVAARMAA